MRLLSGIELVDMDEFCAELEKGGEKFLTLNFSASEREYCESRKKMRHEHYAGRMAVKRAFLKAVKAAGLPMHEIELVRDNGRAPELRLSDFVKSKTGTTSEDKILLSMAHGRRLAVATVVIVKGGA